MIHTLTVLSSLERKRKRRKKTDREWCTCSVIIVTHFESYAKVLYTYARTLFQLFQSITYFPLCCHRLSFSYLVACLHDARLKVN